MTTARKTLTPINTARMQQAMTVKAQSLDDLVAISGLGKQLVTRYVKELRAAKMAHVGDWGRDPRGYPTIRMFAWGDKPDAPKPLKWENDAERMRVKRGDRKEGVV